MGRSGETVVATNPRILCVGPLDFNLSSIAFTQSKAYRRRGGAMIGNEAVAAHGFPLIAMAVVPREQDMAA